MPSAIPPGVPAPAKAGSAGRSNPHPSVSGDRTLFHAARHRGRASVCRYRALRYGSGVRAEFRASRRYVPTASLAGALATADAFVIGSRVVQGVGASDDASAALSIVMNMFEEVPPCVDGTGSAGCSVLKLGASRHGGRSLPDALRHRFELAALGLGDQGPHEDE
jgi:hypothetical protein